MIFKVHAAGKEESATNIHCEVCATYGVNCVDLSTICHWCEAIREGQRSSLLDEAPSGRSADSMRNSDPEFYATSILNFVERYEKCLEWEDDYIEK